MAGRRGRHEWSADNVLPTLVQHTVADQDAPDQCFAQSVDDAEHGTGDE
jgi:hypothetical protein